MKNLIFVKEETDFEKIMAAIKAIRNCRAQMNVVPSVKASLHIETAEREIFESGSMFFERLGGASSIEVSEKIEMEDAVTVVTSAARIFIPLNDLVDKEKELARLSKEKSDVQKDIDFLSGKLNNKGFLAKAPEAHVEEEKAKLLKAEEKMEKIMQSIEAMQK